MRKIFINLSVCIILVANASILFAEQKIALVVGNSKYASAPLSDAVNDVDLISLSLSKLGFDVNPKKNVNQKELRNLINEFYNKLKHNKNTIGVFYFSGHGMQVDGYNYLIPIGAKINDDSDVLAESVRINEILTKMKYAGNKMNFLFLDACRNNSYEKSYKSEGEGRGFGRLTAPEGTLIAFAAMPNKIALQGKGKYSVFTEALAKQITNPYPTIYEMLLNVRIAVFNKTNGSQTPMIEDMLLSLYSFNPTSHSPHSVPIAKLNINIASLTDNLKEMKSIINNKATSHHLATHRTKDVYDRDKNHSYSFSYDSEELCNITFVEEINDMQKKMIWEFNIADINGGTDNGLRLIGSGKVDEFDYFPAPVTETKTINSANEIKTMKDYFDDTQRGTQINFSVVGGSFYCKRLRKLIVDSSKICKSIKSLQ